MRRIVLLNTIVRGHPRSAASRARRPGTSNNGVTFDNQGETIVLGGHGALGVVAEEARRLALQHVNGTQQGDQHHPCRCPDPGSASRQGAEVKTRRLKRVGINGQNINTSPCRHGATSSRGFAVRTTSQIGGAVSTGALQFATRDGSLNTVVDFLATQNQATILAEPNLIAMSGETASSCGRRSAPAGAETGFAAGTITIQYKQVGVSLSFTPTIIGERINLRVAPEVSELSAVGSVTVPLGTGTVTIPGIRTRKAATTIELGSGQSFAVAGLLQSTSGQDINKFPWLGDVPVLGSLFKSDAYQRSETELVIITPIRRADQQQLQTPLTGASPRRRSTADAELQQPRRAARRRPGAVGPTAGFKLG